MKSAAEVAANPETEAPKFEPKAEPANIAALIPQSSPEAQPQDRRATLELLQIVGAAGMLQQFAQGIIEAELSRDSFNQDYRLARVFATSSVFSDIKGQTEMQAIATAMAKIQLGRSWGLTPADAMQFIYFTNGRPAIMNELIAGKIREAGYDWDPQWTEDGGVVNGCTLWLKKWNSETSKFEPVKDHGGKDISVSFTKAEASRSQIYENGKQIPLTEKWNFKSFPREMYYWRCVARLKKFYLTDILRGAVSVDEAQELPPTGEAPEAGPGTRKVDELRSRGAKIHDIPVTPVNDTSTQTATDDTGGASSAAKPETSSPAKQAPAEEAPRKTDAPTPELTEFQKNVWQYAKSLTERVVRDIMGVHSCEDISQVNEYNWKAIATECEDRLKSKRIQFGKDR